MSNDSTYDRRACFFPIARPTPGDRGSLIARGSRGSFLLVHTNGGGCVEAAPTLGQSESSVRLNAQGCAGGVDTPAGRMTPAV